MAALVRNEGRKMMKKTIITMMAIVIKATVNPAGTDIDYSQERFLDGIGIDAAGKCLN